MTAVNVSDLSREALEDIVVEQASQLRILMEANAALKEERQQHEVDYERLAEVVLKARMVLSC